MSKNLSKPTTSSGIEQFECEVKYLVFKPNIKTLNQTYPCQKIEIQQTYLVPKCDGEERRVRAKTQDGITSYTLTTKRETNIANTRIEKECDISLQEYLALLNDVIPGFYTIHKTRYCFICQGRCIELDIYPDQEQYAILEMEFDQTSGWQGLPEIEGISIISDVTLDQTFSSYCIAAVGTLIPSGVIKMYEFELRDRQQEIQRLRAMVQEVQETREFFVDTPLGKLRVYAKHKKDSAVDFPGVFIDFVSKEVNEDADEDICLACVEFDINANGIRSHIYGDGADDSPTISILHENLEESE